MVVPWATACGARTELSAFNADAGPTPDSAVDAPVDAKPDSTPDAPVPTCTLAWEACKPVFGPLVVSGSDLGQSPDVAFTGTNLLVIYDAYAGNTLSAVSLDGKILWSEDVGGVQQPRLSWNPALGVGLAAVDSGLRWLGADGKPVGSFVATKIEGSSLYGDVCPTASGFTVFYGSNGYSTPPPLAFALLGPQPSATVEWKLLAQGAPRGAAEHTRGPEGLAQYAVSTAYQGAHGDLWEVKANEAPTLVSEFGAMLPLDGAGYSAGVAQKGGHFYLLWGGPDPKDYLWLQWVIDVTTGARQQINKSNNGSSGHMIMLGDEILIASPAIVDPEAVTVVPYDPVTGITKKMLTLANAPHTSHSPRMINTPRGFAVVWNEATGDANGLSALLESFDCCVMQH
ncbi:MAG: hypothetical protein HY898_16345 [Deltaproteobacteria bacterium]|nr:hypothetical protein [Deltaproteobacteria bacterium]